MRVISLKHKLHILIIGLIFAALITLCITAIISGSIPNNLFVIPKTSVSDGVMIDSAEEINEEQFVMSYLSVSSAVARMTNVSHEVILKGTNFAFPYAMNYPVISGGFFSPEMQEGKSRFAVLNEKSAFDIFGGNQISGNELTIDARTYIVAGVIKDYDDEACNIYIPITVISKNPSEFTIPIDIGAERIKNELKYIGITDEKYSFIDGNLAKEIIADKFFAALELILLGLLIGAGGVLIKRIKSDFAKIKAEMLSKYIKELIAVHKKLCLIVAANLACVLTETVLSIMILISLLEKLLKLQAFDLGNISPAGFASEVNTIVSLYQMSNIVLVSVVILYLVLFASHRA